MAQVPQNIFQNGSTGNSFQKFLRLFLKPLIIGIQLSLPFDSQIKQ
jgi:hypothetical protein